LTASDDPISLAEIPTGNRARLGSAPYGTVIAEHGLGASHKFILAEVSDGARVLDVGCASGYLAEALTVRGCSLVGLEPNPEAAREARNHCALVIEGTIESERDRAAVGGPFDYVLFGDVLEHLVDPWQALRSTRSLLAPGGVVIASIPNVAAWPVRFRLLRGRFDYTEIGLLDRTHLRFFTRRTAHDLAHVAGFWVERERLTHLERRAGRVRRALPLPMSVLDRLLVRLWPGMFAQQFVLRLRPYN
jgi:2-polyprenyl-3-methyl-5-hydroxy-6-metoxy-1,4-benzoquinol methylase